jgi:cathepsin D
MYSVSSVEYGSIRVCNGGCQAIADSGTTIIHGPEGDVNAMNGLIGAVGKYGMIQCSAIPNLPSKFVNFGHF